MILDNNEFLAGVHFMYRRRRLKEDSSEIYLLTSDDGKESAPAEIVFETPCLVCACCSVAIAGSEHLLEDPIAYLPEASFFYDLEVLSKNLKCYSATNPASDRFDVIRCRKDVDFVVHSSKYTAAHSWFPGFAWTACVCEVCGNFLGWRFRSSVESTSDQQDFFGLIITRLRPRLMVGLFAKKLGTRKQPEESE